MVELHTGRYAEAEGDGHRRELDRLTRAAAATSACSIECHAGHGLTFDNVAEIATIEEVAELNIGHFLVGEAIFTGLKASIAEMKQRIERCRVAGGA